MMENNFQPGTIVKLGDSMSKNYRGKHGRILKRNDQKRTSQFGGGEKFIEAYDIYVDGDTLRFITPDQFSVATQAPATSEKAMILGALWGSKKWNRKLYAGKVWIDGIEMTLTTELFELIKTNPSPQAIGAVFISEKRELSAKYGERESDFCVVKTWKVGSEIIEEVIHEF